MRHLLVLPVVLLLALSALAAPDACGDWRKRQKALNKREVRYWDDFRTRLGSVYTEWRADWRFWRGDPEKYKDRVESLDGVRDLYLEYLEFQYARLEIDDALVATGGDKAGRVLLGALFDVIKEEAALEKEMAEARPVALGRYYDQRPAVKRYGLATREAGLVKALAETRGAASFLTGDAYDKAKKADKRKSLARRAAVLDALGLLGGEEAQTFLQAALAFEEPGLRIVALENLVPMGSAQIETVSPLLGDPSPAVRRALLETVRDRQADEARWIPLALQAFRSEEGLTRSRALEALLALTGQKHGDDLDAWDAWVKGKEEAIRKGDWKRPASAAPEKPSQPEKPGAPKEDEGEGDEETVPVVRRDVPVAVEAALVFYGVPSVSDHVIFVVSGAEDMLLPADLELQTSRARRHWLQEDPGWRDSTADHRGILLYQLEALVLGMPDDARFALVHLWGSTPDRAPVFGEKKLLKPGKSTWKKLSRSIDKAMPQGQLSVEEGIGRAFELSGLDPLEQPDADADLLDTVYVVDTGWNGGRWGIPEATIADVRRRNRFYRLQVNTIRITDRKHESERLLLGIAEATGGTYLWLTVLP